MKNSIYILSFLFVNVICFSQTKNSKLIEKTKQEKEVDWIKVNDLEKVMLKKSIENSGCRFDIKINPEDYKKYIGKPDPYTNKNNIKSDY